MKNARETKTTLVLGGTGKTGRRVVERLAARGLPTRVSSRSGEPPFDWEDEATWVPALRDVESVYISILPGPRGPGGCRHGPFVRRTGGCERGPAAGTTVRPGRGRGAGQRADGARLWRRLDDPALELVQPELQRGLHAGVGSRWRG